MKKKRFYNNKKRNTKWTEEEKGRKISFADKYVEAGYGSDKFDNKRPKPKKKVVTKDKLRKFIKNLIIIVACFAVISVGYSAMDLYIERNAMPTTEQSDDTNASINDISLNLRSVKVESLSLDGGVMLDSVINETEQNSYSSVTFDLKRDDGTIGYESNLATIDAFGAISSASVDLENSISTLLENDLLPVARISCYKDNIAPVTDLTAAITVGSSIYKDSESNTYLNPNSENTYSYIKGIIEEVKSMGITVFILDNCDLPEEISDDYDDGFDILVKKLYVDFGDSVKFLEAKSIEINVAQSNDNEDTDDEDEEVQYNVQDEINTQLEEKIKNNLDKNKIYYITTTQEEIVKDYLDENKISNYVIVPQEA